MEIEKKFLVKKMPELSSTPYKIIKQGYLNESRPTLRIRQINEQHFLTYKYHKEGNKVNISEEYELPISKECFDNLSTKIIGKMISKKRYYIKMENYLIELDVFENGLVLAEVEFKSTEEASNFIKPSWFGKDVTENKCYRNVYMALNS